MPRIPARGQTLMPGLPIYYQIARTLESRIYHGVYRPGDVIPSETEMGREFGVTRLTVRQALQPLIARDLLIPRRGSGTYVTDHPRAVSPVNFVGFLDDQAFDPQAMEVALYGTAEIEAPDGVREQLRLRPGAKVMLVERLRSIKGVPTLRAVSYLPNSVGKRFPVGGLSSLSMMDLLRDHAGLHNLSGTQTLSAEGASADVAQRLQLTPGAPVLRSDLLVENDSKPCGFAVVHYRPDYTFFTATLIGLPTTGSRSNGARPATNKP